MEVEDHAVVAQEAAGLAQLGQLVAFGDVSRKKLHQDGHGHNHGGDSPGPEGVPVDRKLD